MRNHKFYFLNDHIVYQTFTKRLSFAIYAALYRGTDVLFLRQEAPAIAVTRTRLDGEKEVRQRQVPLASNYRSGFS